MADRRAAQHRDWLARLSQLVAVRMRRLWAERVDIGDIAGSWQTALPDAVTMLRAGITVAVDGAEPYVAGLVSDAGRDPDPQATLRTAPFLNAANRRLLASPTIRTLRRIESGETPAQAVAAGQWLAGAVAQDVTADAGRDAVTAAMTAEPQVRGYLRVPSTPCCGRCAVLAARVYKVDSFARHPRCDCGMRPLVVGEHRPQPMNVADYFRSLSEPDANRLFGTDVSDRIRDGDGSVTAINRAVNANRQMWRRRRRPEPTVTDLTDAAASRKQLFASLTEHGFLAA